MRFDSAEAPGDVVVHTHGLPFHEAPNFGETRDGLCAEYDIGGNLAVLSQHAQGQRHGAYAALNADSSLPQRRRAACFTRFSGSGCCSCGARACNFFPGVAKRLFVRDGAALPTGMFVCLTGLAPAALASSGLCSLLALRLVAAVNPGLAHR